MTERTGVQPPKMTAAGKAVFGIGSAAFGVKDAGFNTFLLIFYNQIIGVPATLVSAAIAIALFVDAFSDPIIGAISDNWRSRLGRRHPFMYASAVPVAVLYFILWTPPHWTGAAMFAYLLVVSIALRVSVACYEIPSAALVAEITSDYDERTSILAWRWFFQVIVPSAVGIIALIVLMRNTPQYPSGILNPAAYPPYALLASVVILVSILMSSFGTRARIPYLRKITAETRLDVGELARQTVHALANRSFVLVTVASLFAAMAAGIGNSLGTYLGIYFWKFTPPQLSTLILAIVLSSVIALPLAPFLSRRFGKKPTGIALAAAWLLISQITPILKLMGLLPPDGSNALLLIFFSSTLLGTTMIFASIVLLVSMITDVNEDNELRTGRRSEGVFAAAGSFINKTVSGIGVFLAGILIDLVHFPQHASPATLNPHIIRNLVLINIPVQFVLLSITITLLSLYKIDRTAHEDNLRKLSEAAAAEGRAGVLIDTPKLG